MPSTPIPDALRLLAPELDQRLGRILASIQPLIASLFLHHPWVSSAVTVPLWNRFGRYARRLSRLLAGIAAGKLPPRRAPRPRSPERDETPARPTSRKPRPCIPTQYGWMLNAMGHHVAVYRNQLERLLAEPAMAELLALAPGAGRILRPLCHMLHLPPPCPPLGHRRPRPASPPAPQEVPRRMAPGATDWRPNRTPCPLGLSSPRPASRAKSRA